MNRLHARNWMRASVALVAAGTAAVMTGCAPEPKAAPVASDKVYSVTPESLTVKGGFVTGELTGMRVVERVEEGGRIAIPARLTGQLVLRNVSADQTVRVVGGRFTYVDTAGKLIMLEDSRGGETALRMAASYGSQDRLDPGQESTQSLEVEFPVAALEAKRLKDIRLGITYIVSPYREESLSFPVSIGGQ